MYELCNASLIKLKAPPSAYQTLGISAQGTAPGFVSAHVPWEAAEVKQVKDRGNSSCPVTTKIVFKLQLVVNITCK